KGEYQAADSVADAGDHLYASLRALVRREGEGARAVSGGLREDELGGVPPEVLYIGYASQHDAEDSAVHAGRGRWRGEVDTLFRNHGWIGTSTSPIPAKVHRRRRGADARVNHVDGHVCDARALQPGQLPSRPGLRRRVLL